MGNIPNAMPSPRIENGILRWYAGDTFTLGLELDILDQDGAEVSIGTSDSLTVNFYDAFREKVYTAALDAAALGGAPEIAFNAETTAKFPAGKYTYDMIFTHGDKTTVVKGNRILVE